jgi:hypothetical protein
MTTKVEKTDDDIDAFDALESEEKEYLKVCMFKRERGGERLGDWGDFLSDGCR